MKRVLSMMLLCALLIVTTCSFWGCSEAMRLRLREEEVYAQKLEEFLAALDDRDAIALRSLFAPAVLREDTQLDQQIEKLFRVYPKGESQHYYDGITAGHYSSDADGRTAQACSIIPVVVEEEYFWIELYYTYLDEKCQDNVGIDEVTVYNMDEYCIRRQQENFERPQKTGSLTICAEKRMEAEMRCINRMPFAFTPRAQVLDLEKVETFIQKSLDWTAFQQEFGHPNVICDWNCYYEVATQNGENTYLEIYFEGNHITQVSLLGEFEWLRTIYTEYEE